MLAVAPEPTVVAARPGMPNRAELFSLMQISVPPRQASRFVVGDNVRGYYEGWTSSVRRGAGYVVGRKAVFTGFGASVGGALLNRSGTELRQFVLPYGFRAEYPTGSEELVLHRGMRALSVRVCAPQPALLNLVCFLDLEPGNTEVEDRDGVLVLGPMEVDPENEDPPYLAVALDRSGFVSTDVADVPLAFVRELNVSAHSGFVVAGSAVPGTELTLTLAFGDTPEEASGLARSWSTRDAVGEIANLWYQALTTSRLWTGDTEFDRALLWAEASAWSFYVDEFGKGLWAGLPWFRDNWGRDTFIALPGTFLVTGFFDDARLVMENFLKYQNRGRVAGSHNTDKDVGRIPNRVNRNEIIYNTVDGTPLMLKAIREYIGYSGDLDFARAVLPAVRLYLESSLQNWVDADGLLTHDDADTWMDARIAGRLPWSPRGNRAIEIQALWYQALRTAGDLETWAGNAQEARRWYALSDRVRQAVERLFWNGSELADRLRSDGSPDFKPRPNAFIAVSYPLDPFWLTPRIQHGVIRRLVPQLVYPYGVASLGITHPYFHPRHENPGLYHKDAAYHNGALWGWLAGPLVSALARWGRQDFAYRLSQNLADQILNQGTLGTLSENANAEPGPDGRPVFTGTFSQSWSVAEFARVAYQDYLGLMPDLATRTLVWAPRLPQAWGSVHAFVKLGPGRLELRRERAGTSERWTLRTPDLPSLRLDFQPLDRLGRWLSAEIPLPPQSEVDLVWDGETLRSGGRVVPTRVLQPAADLGELRFVTPPADWSDFPVLRGVNVLQKIVQSGEYR